LTSQKYGCQLPQATSDIARIFDVASECESLGYDSVWVYDHLAPYWLRPRSCLDGWSLLSAVAVRTSKVKVGSLVTNVNLRNPSLLAKMTSTVDNISGGRLIVGLGVGDRMSISELRSYGYRYPPFTERLTLLRETIMILRSMWTEDDVSFKGKTATLSHATCEPKPKQEGGPPIWIGGKHRSLLTLAAELADGWNYWELSRNRARVLETYLNETAAGFHRRSTVITKSWAGTMPTATRRGHNLVEDMKARISSQMSDGTRYFIASFPANADRKAYEAFAEAVKSLA